MYSTMFCKGRRAAVAVSLLCAALAPTMAAHAADNVIMRLNFTPWGMHAPYYSGKAHGIYQTEGIDLEIRPPAAGQQSEVFIGTGREQFGVTNADSFIKARASGIPIVAVMADEPDNPYSVITLKKSGIDTPAKMKGMKLAWFQALVPGLLDPVLKAGSLTRSDIQLVTVARGSEVQMLAAGQVDGLFGYSFGQALTLEENGMPVNVMPIRDYGVKFYGTVIYTSEALLKSNPDLVKRFVRATMKSFIATHDNTEAAVKDVIAVAPDRELGVETKKLRKIYELYNVADNRERFGLMTDAKWQSSIDLLADGGDLPNKPDPKALYTNDIVNSLDESKALAKIITQPAK
ncbi:MULTISPECIES: ABC transporter substrate-binding protein [unclassified Achromobacter]|uniref:ABC transporter substrate-binding protein n=1 Tax=unclassified Achromobacter TaxID=2626865 RepID=UPI000B5168DB|nr:MULTISPECIES: ABC transporter substrate-binding protein [unclassified Achromobacter]OWT80708.1 hypothetical protein CEY05_04840 [Achromobacter sp. HZ34]OWT81224.1 hypothetical protein CEY04_04830 [Achromobacter sp. HZ28]